MFCNHQQDEWQPFWNKVSCLDHQPQPPTKLSCFSSPLTSSLVTSLLLGTSGFGPLIWPFHKWRNPCSREEEAYPTQHCTFMMKLGSKPGPTQPPRDTRQFVSDFTFKGSSERELLDSGPAITPSLSTSQWLALRRTCPCPHTQLPATLTGWPWQRPSYRRETGLGGQGTFPGLTVSLWQTCLTSVD